MSEAPVRQSSKVASDDPRRPHQPRRSGHRPAARRLRLERRRRRDAPDGRRHAAEADPRAATPAFKLKGDPAAGKALFTKSGCVGCHTLADANATGTVGPNLDQAKPDFRLATARVTLGKGAMPSFKGQLSDQQIADVASYVVKATGGTP